MASPHLCKYITLLFVVCVASKGAVLNKLEVGTENVTAHICPGFCTMGREITCYPPPCPPPPCVDPAKYKPTDCCEFCLNGPDCRAPDGSIVSYNHWKIIDGKNCTCVDPSFSTTCV